MPKRADVNQFLAMRLICGNSGVNIRGCHLERGKTISYGLWIAEKRPIGRFHPLMMVSHHDRSIEYHEKHAHNRNDR